MKKKIRLVFFLVGLVGLILLIYNLDPKNIDWRKLFTGKLLLVLVCQFILWAMIYGVHFVVYREILGPEICRKIGFIKLYQLVVSGFALNSVTPLGLVGGEPYRIMELKPYCGSEKAASTTLTFTIFYVMGHIMLWGTGSILYFIMGAPGSTFFSVLLLVVGAVCLVLTLNFLRSHSRGFLAPIARFLERLPLVGRWVGAKLESKKDMIDEIDADITTFGAEKNRFGKAVALEYLARLMEALEYFLIFHFLGAKISYPGSLLVMSTASLIGNLFFIIPMQTGTREGGMVLALDWLSVDAGFGLMAALLYRIRDLVCIGIGVLALALEKKNDSNTV